jgi:hypothetical protein
MSFGSGSLVEVLVYEDFLLTMEEEREKESRKGRLKGGKERE